MKKYMVKKYFSVGSLSPDKGNILVTTLTEKGLTIYVEGKETHQVYLTQKALQNLIRIGYIKDK